MAKTFLTSGRRGWLAKFFLNATLVLLAGAVGSELLLKITLPWRVVLVVGLVSGFCLGLLFAPDKPSEDD